MTVQFLHSKYKSECQVLNLVNFKGKKKTKLSYSIPVMDPKINGSNMAELVKQEVRKTVETQKHVMLEIKKMIEAELDRAHELLLGALARIRNTVRKKRHYVGIFPILGGGV